MLGREIRLRRKALDFNQSELALQLKVGRVTICQWERLQVGDRTYLPDEEQLAALVAALHPKEDQDTLERIQAQWTYLAMLDLVQIKYPGSLDLFRKNDLRLPIKP